MMCRINSKTTIGCCVTLSLKYQVTKQYLRLDGAEKTRKIFPNKDTVTRVKR